MKVSLIAAIAANGTIGRDNTLPWKIKEDMRFFVDKTRGHCVITGRRNFEAMGRPLPGRTNIVVTRSADLALPGCVVAQSIEKALCHAASLGEQEVFVIGGAEIYRLALPYAHTFYRTRVLADVPGDVKFPAMNEAAWTVRELSRGAMSNTNEHAFVIEELAARVAPLAYALP